MSKKRSSIAIPVFCIVLGCALFTFLFNGGRGASRQEQQSAAKEKIPNSLELPVCDASRPEQIIAHTGYTVSYNPDWHIPNWVAYELTEQETNGTEARADHFVEDPDVQGICPNTRDYSNSGYDRGHMAPAADMKWSETAMRESFYLSNICPQNHNLNKGDWNTLENHVRNWAAEFGSVYVACGPVVSDNPQWIGTNRVAVPDAFYKVLLCQMDGEWQAIGFYFENKAGHKALNTYCRSVDEIEALTGIDFFSKLPDKVEKRVESTYSPAAWGMQ